MYKKILILVPGTGDLPGAVTTGVALASALGAQVQFLVTRAQFPPPVSEAPDLAAFSIEQFERESAAEAGRLLDRAALAAQGAGVPSSGTQTYSETAQAIVDDASLSGCDLIVVDAGSQNALMRLLTGSLVPGLITVSGIPLLICPQRPAGPRL